MFLIVLLDDIVYHVWNSRGPNCYSLVYQLVFASWSSADMTKALVLVLLYQFSSVQYNLIYPCKGNYMQQFSTDIRYQINRKIIT